MCYDISEMPIKTNIGRHESVSACMCCFSETSQA